MTKPWDDNRWLTMSLRDRLLAMVEFHHGLAQSEFNGASLLGERFEATLLEAVNLVATASRPPLPPLPPPQTTFDPYQD